MLLEKAKSLPNKPGCYLMKNSDGIIIYIGKAKSLRARVTSYFKGKHSGKTAIMINQIADFDYILTDTEVESLVLELNLIKKYEPKYNILFKDDKTYPYIAITNDKIPRVKVYRTLYKQKSDQELFGPYPSVAVAKNIARLINRLFPLPKCKSFHKSKCLYFHLGQCLGYCSDDISEEKVGQYINDIRRFLRGDAAQIKKQIKTEINQLNEKLAFEDAQVLSDQLVAIERIYDEQNVEIKQVINADVFGCYVKDDYLAINALYVRYGKVINSKNYLFQIINEPVAEVEAFMHNYYDKHKIDPDLILTNAEYPNLELHTGIKIRKPARGELLKTLKISNANAKEYYEQNIENVKKQTHLIHETWQELARVVDVSSLHRAEIIDNAHLFGTSAVSGVIVYDNGYPNKNLYRKYKIKYSQTNDDYAMMREVIYRRYQKMIIEETKLPEILIVDGGIGQVNAAKEVLNELNLNIKLFGIKKDDKHKAEALINVAGEIVEVKDRKVWRLLMAMSEEVHRFTINYHEKTRNKKTLISELDDIPGIGVKRKSLLYKEFGNIKQMKAAKLEELQKILGEKAGEELYAYWHKN